VKSGFSESFVKPVSVTLLFAGLSYPDYFNFEFFFIFSLFNDAISPEDWVFRSSSVSFFLRESNDQV